MRCGTWLRWRSLRRLSRSSALVLFLCLVALSPLAPGWLAWAFLSVDPLAGLTAMLVARRLLSAFLPAAGLLLLTLTLGRVWCGWLCPLGTLLDWTSPRRTGRRLAPAWRWAKYGLLAAMLVAALVTVQALALLDPLPLLQRGLAGLFLASRTALGGRGDFRPADLAPVLLLGTVLGLNAVVPRFWCRALCPLGALLGLLARPAPLRRWVGSACGGCGDCAERCLGGAIRGDAWEDDPGECLLCLECARTCPQQAVGWRWRAFPARPAVDPSRRSFLISLGAGLLAAGLLRLERSLRRDGLHLLRPPGATEEGLLALCLRCGACLDACPTGALRPALLGASPEGLWTPALIPRLGYCRHTCNACGPSCPSGAIPRLSLEEKQRWVVGIARVDPGRCLPWRQNRRCTVCHDTCPLTPLAVELWAEAVVSEIGERIQVERPRVVEERCIGCGICEYNCPVEGEAAIRVWAFPYSQMPGMTWPQKRQRPASISTA